MGPRWCRPSLGGTHAGAHEMDYINEDSLKYLKRLVEYCRSDPQERRQQDQNGGYITNAIAEVQDLIDAVEAQQATGAPTTADVRSFAAARDRRDAKRHRDAQAQHLIELFIQARGKAPSTVAELGEFVEQEIAAGRLPTAPVRP